MKSDEIYHYHCGGRVELTLLFPNGKLQKIILGNRLLDGDSPQFVVPPEAWQASRILDSEESDWSLLGTTVFPGFEFADFELAHREMICSSSLLTTKV